MIGPSELRMMNVEKFSSILHSTGHPRSKIWAMKQSHTGTGKDDRKSFENRSPFILLLAAELLSLLDRNLFAGFGIENDEWFSNSSLYFFTGHDCRNSLRSVSSID